MKESTSRVLMRFELVLILAPLTILEIVAAVYFIDLYDLAFRPLVLLLIPALLMLSPLIATWRLGLALSRSGSERLQSCAPAWWFLATAGAGLPLAGVSALL